jgi:uncharacterized protein (TIGR02271 family)
MSTRSNKPKDDSTVIPVVRETLQVGKRQVETGKVTVEVTPTLRKQVVDLPLTQETASVERVTINRVVDRPEQPRQEGDLTIVPVYEEVLIVEKRLMLKEEVRIKREKHSRQERREVELRVEEAQVRRSAATGDD